MVKLMIAAVLLASILTGGACCEDKAVEKQIENYPVELQKEMPSGPVYDDYGNQVLPEGGNDE